MKTTSATQVVAPSLQIGKRATILADLGQGPRWHNTSSIQQVEFRGDGTATIVTEHTTYLCRLAETVEVERVTLLGSAMVGFELHFVGAPVSPYPGLQMVFRAGIITKIKNLNNKGLMVNTDRGQCYLLYW